MARKTWSSAKPPLRNILIGATVIGSAILLKKGINTAYERATGNVPPTSPNSTASWRKVLLWSAATGAVLGVTKTLIQSKAEQGAQKLLSDR